MKFLVNALWGYHVLLVILLTGIRLTVSTGFFQIRHFFSWIKAALVPGKNKDGGISGFQALSTALAGSIGTGNIVGVGLAITVGGPGALFWMWISALFSMMTVFGEVVLSVKHRSPTGTPGAFAYIEKLPFGKTKHLAKVLPFIYGLGCVLSSLAMGNMAQSNSIAAAGTELGIEPWITGIFLCIVLFIITGKGISGVAKVTEKLVPIMTILFFAVSLYALFSYRHRLPAAIQEVFEGAFSLRGGLGGGMFIAMKTGISRAVFTNEAGLGSSSMAFANVKGKSPKELGYLGIFQVFLDTTVMCTITGLCVLCCTEQRQGEFLVRVAFENAMGPFGAGAMNLCMALFAFATMTATCYYGKQGLSYISKGKLTKYFPAMFGAAAFLGSVLPLSRVFEFCDVFNGLMAIPNLIALAFFSAQVVQIALEKDEPDIPHLKRNLSFCKNIK